MDFGNIDTSTVFLFLAQAFLTDYAVNHIFIDSAGWRTQLEIAEGTKLPTTRIYGRDGKDLGPALGELMRRGLIEWKSLAGQRGRGGIVRMIRINNGNPYVKSELDRVARHP